MPCRPDLRRRRRGHEPPRGRRCQRGGPRRRPSPRPDRRHTRSRRGQRGGSARREPGEGSAGHPRHRHHAPARLRGPGRGPGCARRAGGPVAVKLLDATVLHKTEIGGVALGIRDSAELESALDALETAGACRFLVERMAPGGVDLVVGARRDAVFGPIVLVGLGGTTAEAVADVSVRLAPLTAGEAALMPAELAGRALLEGWRNGPSLDPAALGEVVARLGGVLAAAPDLAEIEVNPLRLTDDGLVALDAVVLHRKAADARPRQ
ncbi:acetate--CoA ligase family protein [Pseudonocardia benzenivorans]